MKTKIEPHFLLLLIALLSAPGLVRAQGASFFTPGASTPAYVQFSNSPFFGIDFSRGYFHLETFEDDALNTPGVTATNGSIIGVEDFGSLVDSVDADDGVIDGTGQTGGLGRSYFGGAFTFAFNAAVLGSLPTHVGIVWTDGSGPVTIQAFDANGSSLGQATGVVHADSSFSGTTGDDRFYGVVHAGGISRIILSSSTQEADHLQYGFTVSTRAALLAAGFSTAIPDGTGNFISLRGASLSGEKVTYFGAGGGGQQGIYVSLPGEPAIPPNPVRIANTSTAIPGGSGTFTAFTIAASISGDNVAFLGDGAGGQQGIYRAVIGGAVSQVADKNTAIPSGTGTFTSFLPGEPTAPAIDGANVAFFGAGGNGQQGIYVALPGEPIRPLANTATAIPGGSGNFTALPGEPMISGENVAFIGDGAGGQQGIYRAAISGAVSAVADKNTAIPGGTGTFTSFLPPNPVAPAIKGASVAFFGAGGGGQRGVYASFQVAHLSLGAAAHDAPVLVKIADTATAIPGGTGNFLDFGDVSIDGTNVAFLGFGANGQQGIYDLKGGSLFKVVDLTDILDGRAITGLEFSRTGLVEDRVAFQATFTDGSQGIYTADVVPPFALRISAVEKLGTSVRLSFTSQAGINYAIQGRSNLSSGTWATLAGTTNSGTGGTVQQTLTNALTQPQQFYQVKQLP